MMAATVQAILGHPQANSYLTLAQAEAYILERMDVADWTAQADADAKNRLLITASREIDQLMLFGRRIFFEDVYKQALRFPVYRHNLDFWLRTTGTADSGSATTLVDATLIDTTSYRDDLFIGGALLITSGTGKYTAHETVTDFDVTTGTVTFADCGSTLDSTSVYDLIGPLPEDFKLAILEQALFLASGNAVARAQMVADGVTSYDAGGSRQSFGTPENARTQPNLYSAVTLQIIDKYLQKGI